MLDNHKFNLINQLSQESKSLWRIEKTYMEDAGDNDENIAIWKEIANEKRKSIELLEKQLSNYIG